MYFVLCTHFLLLLLLLIVLVLFTIALVAAANCCYCYSRRTKAIRLSKEWALEKTKARNFSLVNRIFLLMVFMCWLSTFHNNTKPLDVKGDERRWEARPSTATTATIAVLALSQKPVGNEWTNKNFDEICWFETLKTAASTLAQNFYSIFLLIHWTILHSFIACVRVCVCIHFIQSPPEHT